MRRRFAVLGAASLLVSMTMAGSAGAHHSPPAANPLNVGACGITTSATVYTLTHDIGPCTGDGLIVGATTTQVNLNGWDIIGDGPATTGAGDAGIRVVNRTTALTLTDVAVAGASGNAGRVTLFNAGVYLAGSSQVTVENLDLVENFVLGSQGQNFSDLGDGIQLFDSSTNNITNNNVVDNEGWSGIQLYGNSDNNRIEDNVVSSNAEATGGVVFAHQTSGIRVECNGASCPNGNVIYDNDVNENGNDGIQLFSGANNNTIRNNRTHENGRDGIHLFPRANSNKVYGNDARENGAFSQGDGINVGGSLNAVTSNVVYENQDDGISLGFCRQNLPNEPIMCPAGINSATTNTIDGNWASNNGSPGATAPPEDLSLVCELVDLLPDELEDLVFICESLSEDEAHGSGIRAHLNTDDNTISNNNATSNVVWDLQEDSAPTCNNTWITNNEGTKNATCIN